MRTHRVCLFLAAVMLLLVALPGATAARIVPSNTLHLRLPEGRPILFGFWCWWALANLARCGRVYV